MWSTAAKKVLIIKLTIPWEEGMSAAYEHMQLKYSDLAAECREGGWMTGTSLKKSIKELAEEEEKASYWLWLRRGDRSWGSTLQ
ncbi:hypothetical protein AOLI_G00319150 [Acnodon oligacanthus]